ASAPIAADVARGVTRLLARHDLLAIGEVPLEGGRRVDLMAIDARGQIVIVEIKVSRADLLGDAKWTDYLDHCDRFFWAVPAGFDVAPLMGP
ncbi:MmcB family DNA repair protein, partial [Enterococcus faecium]|uniref:MmcB family DNA repair protein n=2 Tax=Bacteria TaxID=2 RepID=UPI003F525D1E